MTETREWPSLLKQKLGTVCGPLRRMEKWLGAVLMLAFLPSHNRKIIFLGKLAEM
jgi:hypothetical protein